MFDFLIELIEPISLNKVTCVERERMLFFFMMAYTWQIVDWKTWVLPPVLPQKFYSSNLKREQLDRLWFLCWISSSLFICLFLRSAGGLSNALSISLSLCPLLCSLCVGLYLPLSVVYFMNLPVNFAFSLTFAFRVFLSYQSFRWPHNTVFWGLFIYLLVLISWVNSKSQQKLQIKKCFS